MRKEEYKTINEKTYTVKQLSPFVAMEVQLNLLKLFGGDLSLLFKDEGQFLEAIRGLEVAEVLALTRQLIQGSSCVTDEKGRPVNVDVDFDGYLMGIYELLAFVLVVNFKDFFLELRKRIPELMASFNKMMAS